MLCYIAEDGNEIICIMAVKLNTINCPHCGAELPVEEKRKELYCSFCGSKIIVNQEDITVYQHRNSKAPKDESKEENLNEIDDTTVEAIEDKLVENNKNELTLFYIWLIVSALILIASILCTNRLNHPIAGRLLLLFVGAPVSIGGAYYIFNVLPEKDHEKLMIAGGGIRIPESLILCKGKDYMAISNSLRDLGFEKISCINLQDVKLGIFRKPNKIEKITIDGKEPKSDRIYFPDSNIEIKYHGKK